MVTALFYSYSPPFPEPIEAATPPFPWLTRVLHERLVRYDPFTIRPTEPDPGPQDTDVLPAPDLVDLYFEDASRRAGLELLTHQQEIQLSQAIETGRIAATELQTIKGAGLRNPAQTVH